MKTLRKEIDVIDDALLNLLAKRMEIVQKIGEYKQKRGLPALDQKRWDALLTRLTSKAKATGIDPNFVKIIWNSIHKYALTYETI